MTLEEKARRGQAAERILKDEVYREAWASLDAALIANWAVTSPADITNRERYFHQLQGLRAVKTKLETWISDGTAAIAEIERTKQRATGTRQPATP
jgi:hypothetical protein